MNTKTSTNSQARKSLADQIDRLDGMLDGLSDGLNEAVAQAVKDAVGAAVQQAVQAVLREVLTNPEMAAGLHGAPPAKDAPPPVPPPDAATAGWTQRWASVLQAAGAWVAAARLECGRRLEQARRRAAGAWDRVRGMGRFLVPLLTAVGVGVTVGVAAWAGKPWLVAAAAGAGEFVATLAVQFRAALKRLTTPAVASMA